MMPACSSEFWKIPSTRFEERRRTKTLGGPLDADEMKTGVTAEAFLGVCVWMSERCCLPMMRTSVTDGPRDMPIVARETFPHPVPCHRCDSYLEPLAVASNLLDPCPVPG